jgi:DMSO/TMAO reductase YedYZ molybdopterin-dependent catalytic subunit
LIPPDAAGVYGPGHALTYAAHRLLGRDALAREFDHSQISNPPYANGKPPKIDAFVQSQAQGFSDWTLEVDGMVERPRKFSLAELRGFPQRSQITALTCEEGWNYIAEWTGPPLAQVLETVGISPKAKFVFYFSIQPSRWDSVDMADAFHPQTLVALGMNGGELPVGNGGPVRVRVPRQLGYKSVKWVTKLTVTDTVKGFGKGMGSAAAEAGYAWYNGI